MAVARRRVIVRIVSAVTSVAGSGRHLRRVVIVFIGCVVAANATAPAIAGSPIYVATDLGARQHPRTLITHQPGVTYRFTSLRWRAWGKLRPRAHGRLTVCANMAACEKRGSVTIDLRELRTGRCDAVRGRFYVRGTMIANAKRTPLDLRPSYVC